MTADAPVPYSAGYSNELYDTIAQYGLRRNSTLIDIGCGTGTASEPFARNGIPVTAVDASETALAQARERMPNATFACASAEALPFGDSQFDVAISAQSFHAFDRVPALREMVRVLKPGGMAAIWWKIVMWRDPVNQLREAVARELGHAPVPYGLQGSFKEFYGAPFQGQTVRVLPWRSSLKVSELLAEERAQIAASRALGPEAASAYCAELEKRLRGESLSADPRIAVGYNQYLYLAKKP